MKKLILIIALLFAMSSINMQAQTEKGKFLLSGSSSIQLHSGGQKYKSGSTTEKNYSYNDFYFQPAIGYFVINNLL